MAAAARKEELKAQLAKVEQEKLGLVAKMLLEVDAEAEAEEANAVRSLQDMEVSTNPRKIIEDTQEPSQSSNGADNRDEDSDDDEKNGPGYGKHKVAAKKACSYYPPIAILTVIHRKKSGAAK
jgi:hypothetical protein